MRRVLLVVMLCGLAAGCGGSKPTAPDDPEAMRQAEEDARREGERENAAEKARQAELKKKYKGKKPPPDADDQ